MHVGLVGTGRIGALHARELSKNPLVETLTVTDADGKRAAGVADAVGARWAGSPEALFEAGIDAVVIAAATPAHATLLHLAADERVPAFCEKPIALDLAATDAVIDHIKRAGIMVQIGFQRRFDAGYRAARDAVQSGALGDVHIVRLATHDPAPPPEAYIADSGGIWLDLAIHDFDIAAWVTGRQVVEVYSDGQANAEAFVKHDDVDAACAVLRLEGGVLGVLTASRNDPLGYDVRMEVFGLRDSVAVGWNERIPLRSIEPGVDAPSGPAFRDFMERFEPAYRAELQGFLEAVRDGGDSPCTVAEARQALAVALTADRSRREHRPPGYLPSEPGALRELLGRTGLSLAAGFLAVVLHDHDHRAEAMAEVRNEAEALAAAGADVLVLAAALPGDTYDRHDSLPKEAWARLTESLAAASEIAATNRLGLALHPHAGTAIESAQEVTKLLETTDVDICLDTGHLFLGGSDPLKVVLAAGSRVRHVHLKDVDAATAARVRSGVLAYAAAVRSGLYRPLGQGDVDIAAVFNRLQDSRYNGWYVLEQDTALTAEPEPAVGPIVVVRQSLEFFRALYSGAKQPTSPSKEEES